MARFRSQICRPHRTIKISKAPKLDRSDAQDVKDINVHTVFENNGMKAKCNLCGTVSDVPPEHYGPTNEFGQRLDSDQRPEYRYGTFEFKLSDNWLNTKPVMPCYVFCIDISSTAIMNGFFSQVVSTIK